MGFFQDFRRKRELDKLEAQIRKNPTPSTYYDLCQKLHEQGKLEQALSWAQDGIYVFPETEQLLNFQNFVKKELYKKEINELQNQLKLNPSAAVYNRLSEIFIDLGNESKATQYCEECQEKFPDDDGPYLLFGEIRVTRFKKDYLAKDGMKAIEYLEMAYSLNQRNYRALMNLGELYLGIGAINTAKERLKAILQFAPEDGKVKELLKIARSRPEPKNEDIEELLKNVESSQAPYSHKEKKVYNQEDLEKKLAGFLKFPDMEHALFCNIQGTLLGACRTSSSITKETFCAIISEIYKTSQISSQRMDIGNLQDVHVKGSFGVIFIHLVAEETLLAVLISKSGKEEAVSREFHRIASTY
jgi:tetratricopeptide (TPR) repeat protein